MNKTDLSAQTGDTDRTDTILEGLKTSRRRRILLQLRQSGSTTVNELVAVVSGGPEKTGTEPKRADSLDRQLTHSTLVHLDVPKLECLGLVTFDPVAERVDLAVDRREIDRWLDLAVEMDVGGWTVPRASTAGDHQEVLVVEDDPDSAALVADYLHARDDGMVVTTAPSVEAAMALLRDRPVDCIVSDLRLPAISGLDLLKLVRNADPTVPFVLFTGDDSDETATEAVDAGVTGYVRKSGGTRQFADLVRQVQAAVEAR